MVIVSGMNSSMEAAWIIEISFPALNLLNDSS
jgi:hypothetical protein